MAFSVVRCPECGFQISEESTSTKGRRQGRAFDDRDSRGYRANTTVAAQSPSEIGNHASRFDDPNWVVLAKFQNAAMAGYFADELHRQFGFATEVDLQEEREPIHSTWTIRFCLLVEKGTARQAAYALQLIARDDSDADPLAPKPAHPVVNMEPRKAASHIGRLTWIMSILALVAVLFVILMLSLNPRGPWQRGRVGGPGWQRAMAAQQFAAINGDGAPWTQPINAGAGTRRLSLNAARQVSVIETDADGDGRFESTEEFPWPTFDPVRPGQPRNVPPNGAPVLPDRNVPDRNAARDGQPRRVAFDRPPFDEALPRQNAAGQQPAATDGASIPGPSPVLPSTTEAGDAPKGDSKDDSKPAPPNAENNRPN